jgi:glyoxylase-like metal-dependent hydrolase (beta-lactamase superfamily II)
MMGARCLPITAEVWQVGGYGYTDPQDAAIYLVTLDDRAALVDAGCGRATDLLLANIEATGTDSGAVDWLLLTHCHYDHAGGAQALRRRLGCRVVAHVRDAPFIETGDDTVTAASWYGAVMTPCAVDRKIAGTREVITVGGRSVEAIAIPGHSPGSLAYLLESGGKRVLFAQDVHGPLHPDLLSNRDDYRSSLARLRDLGADVLCEGHYGIYRGRSAVDGYISQFISASGDARHAERVPRCVSRLR